MKFSDALTPVVTVLVCKLGVKRAEKLKYAAAYGIPVVNEQWLLDCLETGGKQPFTKYLLQPWVEERPSTTSKLDHALDQHEQQAYPKDADYSIRRSETAVRIPELVEKPKKTNGNNPGLANERVTPFAQSPSPESAERSQSKNSEEVSSPDGAKRSSHLGSQPLKEIASEVNSPRKPTPLQDGDSQSSNSQKPKSFLGPLSEGTSKDDQHNNSSHQIAELLALKKAGRSNSSVVEVSAGRRRKGLLGRAASATFTISASNSLSRTNSSDGTFCGNSGASNLPEPPMPSQVLGYEDPEARRQVEERIRQMGGTVEEGPPGRVERIGRVKDLDFGDGDGGVAARVRRRARQGGRGVG